VALAAFDKYLGSRAPLHAPIERLLQGPVADALTHTGQLAMIRRMAGSPTRGENFYLAGISLGEVAGAAGSRANFLVPTSVGPQRTN